MTELEINKEKNLREIYKSIIIEILERRFKNYEYKYHYSLYSDYFIINLQNNSYFTIRLSNHKPCNQTIDLCWISYNFRQQKIRTKEYIESKILTLYGVYKKLNRFNI